MQLQPTESQIVSACIRWLWANGCYVWRQNTGGFKDKRGQYVSFGTRGCADIIGVTPTGKFIGCECKSAKGKPSEAQDLFRDRIQAKNGLYVLARSTDDLERRKGEILA